MKVQKGDNVIQKELQRRKRVVHRIILFFMVMIGSLFFATLNIPNPWTRLIILAVEVLCLGAAWCNHTGRSSLAGIFVVSICEGGLMGVIVTTQPFDSTNLPLLDLFVMAITLTVSLLPARFAFFVAGINTLFIVLVLLYQPHTRSLDIWISMHFYNAFIRPVALQWICVVISYLWVQSTNKLIANNYGLQTELFIAHQRLDAYKAQTTTVDTNLID